MNSLFLSLSVATESNQTCLPFKGHSMAGSFKQLAVGYGIFVLLRMRCGYVVLDIDALQHSNFIKPLSKHRAVAGTNRDGGEAVNVGRLGISIKGFGFSRTGHN